MLIFTNLCDTYVYDTDVSYIDREFKFAISSYPFTLKDFSALLKDVLNPDVQDTVFGDFKPLGEVDQPGYYIHVVKKQLAD